MVEGTIQLNEFPSTLSVSGSDLIYAFNVGAAREQATTVAQLQTYILASMAMGNNTPAGTLTGTENVTISRGNGLLQTTVAAIAALGGGSSGGDAAASAAEAAQSATEAGASATAASTSETNAAASAGAASAANTASGESASAASQSATTAAGAASSATGSATSAADSATTAGNSATAAGTASANAGGFANTASAAATAAGLSETNAAGSASAASGSATAAGNSATTAGTAASAAQAAAAIAVHGVQANSFELTLNMPATAGATVSGNLATGITNGMLVMQMLAVNSFAGGIQNYGLALYDGSAAGTLLYQVNGVTDQTFSDTGLFYIPTLSTGTLFVQVTNIDADQMTLAITATALGIAT